MRRITRSSALLSGLACLLLSSSVFGQTFQGGLRGAVRDANGVFHFVARADDMIISSGYNIAGPEVEAALLAHADVAECAVVGAPDPDRGQIVQAHVVLKEGVAPDEACAKRLQDHVKATIAPYKYPRSVKFVGVLPRTQTGKIQRFKLKPQ